MLAEFSKLLDVSQARHIELPRLWASRDTVHGFRLGAFQALVSGLRADSWGLGITALRGLEVLKDWP